MGQTDTSDFWEGEVYAVFDWDDRKSYLGYFNLPEVQKALADTGTTEIVEVSESFNLEA